jgi:hypothetical protein
MSSFWEVATVISLYVHPYVENIISYTSLAASHRLTSSFLNLSWSRLIHCLLTINLYISSCERVAIFDSCTHSKDFISSINPLSSSSSLDPSSYLTQFLIIKHVSSETLLITTRWHEVQTFTWFIKKIFLKQIFFCYNMETVLIKGLKKL